MDIDQIQVGKWYRLARPSVIFENETCIFNVRVTRKYKIDDHLTNDRIDMVDVDWPPYRHDWPQPTTEILDELPRRDIPWRFRLAEFLEKVGRRWMAGPRK